MPAIFLVEDDASLAMGLLFTFEEEGFSTLHAKTAAEARAIFAQGGFDLIVLDVMLPDGNGYELCREFRKTSDVPIVFLTSCDDEINVVMGLDGGGDDYVTKPFSSRCSCPASRRSCAGARRGQGGQLRAGNVLVEPEQRQGLRTGKRAAADRHRAASADRLCAARRATMDPPPAARPPVGQQGRIH